MDYHHSFKISASGMALEKMRLDVTASNLAHIHTTARPGGALYKPLQVVANEAFRGHYDQVINGVSARIEAVDVPPRQEYDPRHPYANESGFVSYPAIEHALEMMNMSLALRGYEANVVAFNAAKTMAARTLTIGDQ